MTQFENKRVKFHFYLILIGTLFILFSAFSIMPVASQDDSKPTLFLTEHATQRPPRRTVTSAVPAVSLTPVPSPTEIRDDITSDLVETAGFVYYQNRQTPDLPIEIRILTEDLILVSTTQADPTGTYQISIPADQFFWLEIDAPLHRLIRIGINPGQSLPDIRLVGGDLNGDACVGASDMALMIQNFDRTDTPDTDITGDGLTDASDLAILAGNFQPECEALPPYVIATPIPVPDTSTPTLVQNTVPVPFYDTFDSDTGWLADGAWRFETETAYEGTGWFADSTQRGLLSILQAVYRFDLSVPVHLYFWEKAALASNDRAAVSISLDDGVSWVLLDEQTGLITDWARRALDLTAFQGEVIQLRFTVDTTLDLSENETTSGYWIDNLSLEPLPPADTETPTPTLEAPTVTPTPSATPTLTPTPPQLPVALPYIDSFDSGLGWLPDGTWQLDTQTAFNGASWFADNTQAGQISRLEYSGLIGLTTALNPQLQFWQLMWLNPTDQFLVEVSLDNGISWSLVERQIGVGTDWTLHVLDLSLYRDYPIRLRFTLDTTESFPDTPKLSGCWIDELLIQDAPTSATPTPVATATATAPSTDTPTVEPSATPFIDVTSLPLPTVFPTRRVFPTPTLPQAPPRAATLQPQTDTKERGN